MSKRGRPFGAKTEEVPVVEIPASRCPACGSTQREGYYNVVRHPYCGTTPDGHEYTEVVWRYTRCSDCQQRRVDKTYE